MGARRVAVREQNAERRLEALERAMQERDAGSVMNEGGLQAAGSTDLTTQEIIKAANTSLTMIRGDTRFLEIAAKQADGVTAFDITNATLWFTAKVNVSDADPGQFQKHTGTGGGITKTNAVGGIARVHIEPANTEGLTADTTLVWDAQMRTTEGYVYTLDWGSLTVERAPDITTTRTPPA